MACRRRIVIGAVGALFVAAVPACDPPPSGIRKIEHVIVIMQENRSFDEYFGTYPGANGHPRDPRGNFTQCLPDPGRSCVKPFHDANDINPDGPHDVNSHAASVNGGKMDGFVAVARNRGYPDPRALMGYHDRRELPNYWAYADNFVLHDRMFEPVAAWSEPAHLYMVSGWSATCNGYDPMSCRSELISTDRDQGAGSHGHGDCDDVEPPCHAPDYAWTDLTYLLHKHNVSWKYYKAESELEIWNPLPDFQTVHKNRQLGNIQNIERFYADAKAGTLPAVSWVVPGWYVSDHPPTAKVSDAQAYVTGLVNSVMHGPDWKSTAIFLAWDDWGGYYDHVAPPRVDGNGYGLRVPSLLISPYAKRHYIDHQTLSFDAYLKFVEDDFMGGERIDPRTDGRPDSRPTVRESVPGLGNLSRGFDFSQSPRPPVFLAYRPSAITNSATGVGRTTATFSGEVVPNQLAATVRFEWGRSSAYGSTTPAQNVGSGGGVKPTFTITGLAPGTTYHYRVSATNARGTTRGSDRLFRTPA